MSKFVQHQEVQVLISKEFTTVSRVFMTENGVRYNLHGRPVDVHYHDDMLEDAKHVRRLQAEADAKLVLAKKREVEKREIENQRAGLNSSTSDSGAAMIATQVLIHEPDYSSNYDEPTRSTSSSHSSSGYDSSHSYSSYDSGSSSSDSSSSSCD